MKIFAETPRLILREFLEQDVDALFSMDSDPKVHAFLGKRPVEQKSESEKVIVQVRKQYQEHGIGRWAVILKETGDFVGWSGLKWETRLRPGMEYYDLGYRLKQKFWGLGIASESAAAAVAYGFTQIKLQKICGAAHIDNLGSIKVLKRLGLRFTERFEFGGMPCNFYELDQEEWLKMQ